MPVVILAKVTARRYRRADKPTGTTASPYMSLITALKRIEPSENEP